MSTSTVANSPTDNASRRWFVCVVLCLWLFAAWQIFLLAPEVTIAKRLGVAAPRWTEAVYAVPVWAPLLVGIPLTVATARSSGQVLRFGVLFLALSSAMLSHWGSVSLMGKMLSATHKAPVAAIK